jgi:hypothetical protein
MLTVYEPSQCCQIKEAVGLSEWSLFVRGSNKTISLLSNVRSKMALFRRGFHMERSVSISLTFAVSPFCGEIVNILVAY